MYPISNIPVRLYGRPTNITVIKAYAPTTTTDETIEGPRSTPPEDMLEKTRRFHVEETTLSGLGYRNEREFFLFAAENEVIMCNTIFEQHKPWFCAWTAPDGIICNQTDYIQLLKSKRIGVRNTHTS